MEQDENSILQKQQKNLPGEQEVKTKAHVPLENIVNKSCLFVWFVWRTHTDTHIDTHRYTNIHQRKY